ncbi:hypothetical protein ND856_13980 [Leptospira bandrabouensis]|uniref:hypothetical protein n=1 Tax=Leptospira bandrabouensis TaxID=2484903 RepID=UPI00223CB2AF|nr:hypothetical protein [Leptospira bandrabouensis]MCW7459583.1 hypothetical protein [Leptospira bandrabouensis]MCW7478399.1 hypothetical protein [Leptospira bandrabouensis]MCW7486318.1 hypothetical protein [Leptospira bandrabouensis]
MSGNGQLPGETIDRYREALEEIQDLAASDTHGDNADEIHSIAVSALGNDEEDDNG